MALENLRMDADTLALELKPEDDRNKVSHLTVENRQLREVIQSLLEKQQARFIVSVGSDRREHTGKFEVTQVFSLDSLGRYVLVRTPVNPSNTVIDSITSLIPGANFSEREIQDLLGIKPEGHPDPRRLILPDDWPDGIHPLRKDFVEPEEYHGIGMQRESLLRRE